MSFCGESKKTISTTGNHVTIEFKSDGTVNHNKGVQEEWYAGKVYFLVNIYCNGFANVLL